MFAMTNSKHSDGQLSALLYIWNTLTPHLTTSSGHSQMHVHWGKNYYVCVYVCVCPCAWGGYNLFINPCHMQRMKLLRLLVVWWQDFPAFLPKCFYSHYFYEVIQLGNNCLPKLSLSGEPLNTALVSQRAPFIVFC